MIDGVSFIDERKKLFSICTIHFLSDEFKQIIREQLTLICYGYSKANTGRKSYQYENTLKEFFKRYSEKPKKIKIGMMGELLTHILLLKYFDKLEIVSPFFNTEERSIKKGFDLILYSNLSNELWITEVKSGELYIAKNANQMTSIFLNKAKKDLYKRLNENESSLWENAINGAKIVLDSNHDKKVIIENILMNIEDEITENKATSLDKNVIFVSSLFNPLTTTIDISHVEDFKKRLKRKRQFKKEFILSIQKGTFLEIEKFLKSECI